MAFGCGAVVWAALPALLAGRVLYAELCSRRAPAGFQSWVLDVLFARDCRTVLASAAGEPSRRTRFRASRGISALGAALPCLSALSVASASARLPCSRVDLAFSMSSANVLEYQRSWHRPAAFALPSCSAALPTLNGSSRACLVLMTSGATANLPHHRSVVTGAPQENDDWKKGEWISWNDKDKNWKDWRQWVICKRKRATRMGAAWHTADR